MSGAGRNTRAWEIARIDPLLVLPALAPGKTLGPVPGAAAGRIPGVEPHADPDADIDPDPVTRASA